MLRRLDRKEARRIGHRKAQAAYMRRCNAGVARYVVVLGCRELDNLPVD
jgi:hypothetical protein